MKTLFLAMSVLATTALWADADSAPPYRVPEHVFAGESRGPFQTGTVEELWIDTARAETTTIDPSDRRHLLVQIWYPAEFKGDPERAKYVLHPDYYAATLSNYPDTVKATRSTSVLDAPVASQPTQFPVLLYNPGGWHPHFGATFQTEFLASHGYIVVSIGHTGLSQIERFPDGYIYKPDINLNPLEDEPETKQLSTMELFNLNMRRSTEGLMPVHMQDIRFVLDRLQSMNSTRGNRFYQRLDLEHVGALGHSIGGALALQASRDEPRLKAAADLDGWLYTDVANTGTHRPVLLMRGDSGEPGPESSPAERELVLTANALFWRMLSKTDADWYDLRMEKTPHGAFADDSVLVAADTASIHPRLAHDIINGYTLEFFDKYLRGRTETPLLSGKVAYPEAKLSRSAAK